MEKTASQIKDLILSSSSIAILSHINPDGDSIGSSMALKYAIKELGKQADVFIDEPIHSNFSFLRTNEINQSQQNNYDLVFVLDCPEIKRVGECMKYISPNSKLVNIDHHPDNANFAQTIISRTDYCSTCLILYDIFKQWNIDINPFIATCLYTGIATDTGCFIHNNTDIKAHISAGELIDKKADFELVNFLMFTRKTVKQVKLFSALLNELILECDNQVAIACITQKMFEQTNTSKDDAIGYVSYLNGIETVKFAIVMQEQRSNVFLVSIRSRDMSAKKIANHFGGGGHEKASGCKIFANKNFAIMQLLEECKKELHK